MFFSKIFFFFLLVNQLLQISSADSCGNDSGLAFEPTGGSSLRSKASPYNLPWTIEVVCSGGEYDRRQTHGTIISGKHILGLMKERRCDDNLMRMKFSERLNDPESFKKVYEPISSMKEIEGAPHLALITLKDEFKFEDRNFAVCLPNKEYSVSFFEGQFIYSRYSETQYRTRVETYRACKKFTQDMEKFCSGDLKAYQMNLRNGVPGTVKRNGRHILLGLANAFASNKIYLYYNVVKHVEAIRKQMAEDVDKSSEPSTSADDTKSAGFKPSSIYEVVNKNANK